MIYVEGQKNFGGKRREPNAAHSTGSADDASTNTGDESQIALVIPRQKNLNNHNEKE